MTTFGQKIFGGFKYNNFKIGDATHKCHDDDIVSFDYFYDENKFDKDGKEGNTKPIKLIASGQRGLMPLILVWEADTKIVVNKYYLPKGAK